MKKISKILLSLLLGLFVFTACSIEGGKDKADDSSNKAITKEEKEDEKEDLADIKIGVSMSTLNNPFFVSVREGIEEVAKDKKVNVVIMDAQNDSSTQSNQVEDLITQGLDLIIINPVDSTAISPSVQNANDANIPVICVDRKSDEGKVVSLVASDNVKGGEMAGEFILKAVGEGAQVVQLEGIPGASSTRERGEGFKNATDGKIDLVASQTANFDRAEGMSVMENLLQAHPELKAVFSQNDEMAMGAAEAIKASGKNITIVGFDGNEDALKAVEEGKLSATVAQKPKEMGKIALETAIKYLQGEKVEEYVASPLELVKSK
ncbi:D-ribose ABC transporter substrate-binding protein [Anaerococcus sp. AGMB00486]|uniref:D-ribose ABC transporter substrate-binding protein n=2 Tax=Anaerococcus TaxID=165779 RepID=A0ABX2NDG2_9FIRM|nr:MULTISPECIES: D-ribose ABC transporter substrate-binding protein [Anaerococcus]MDY3005731.1 D-ribose ABC transporter substrate-binding protein [Anaerococcus porci]MSS77852.1 D-ribose ABC transporter substrate-binding protein [Anaerococcus porci]NVF12507.1 D-ribose ABC transporter substrate-binding protein [Anaerococcus faecalis]